MNPCPTIDQILNAMVGEDGDDVRRHVVGCPSCSAQVAQLTEVLDVLAGARASHMPDAWVDEVVERLSPQRPEARAWAWRDLLRYAAPTFGLTVLTSIVLLMWSGGAGAMPFDAKAMIWSALLLGVVAMLLDIGYLRRRGRAR